MKFAYYDIETTGISPAFDQPLQFAAILTDSEFREIERVNLRCRIARHIIPSPWAVGQHLSDWRGRKSWLAENWIQVEAS